jgi:hypothetical protein
VAAKNAYRRLRFLSAPAAELQQVSIVSDNSEREEGRERPKEASPSRVKVALPAEKRVLALSKDDSFIEEEWARIQEDKRLLGILSTTTYLPVTRLVREGWGASVCI